MTKLFSFWVFLRNTSFTICHLFIVFFFFPRSKSHSKQARTHTVIIIINPLTLNTGSQWNIPPTQKVSLSLLAAPASRGGCEQVGDWREHSNKPLDSLSVERLALHTSPPLEGVRVANRLATGEITPMNRWTHSVSRGSPSPPALLWKAWG